MANQLKIGVENPDELLNAGAYGAGALIQIQSATTEAGAFADISGTGSTPTIAIVAGTYGYTGYDPNGASTTWYRTRYKNAGGSLTSDWSAAFQVGAGGYTSLYNVKQDIGKTTSEADELLLDYITEVTDYIKGVTGQEFGPDATASYLYDGFSAKHGMKCLPVPGGVRAITTLKIAPATGGTLTTVTSGTYFLRPTTADRSPGWPPTEVWLSDQVATYFPPGYDNVEITGTFGFAAVPARIEGIARRTVVRAYAARQAGDNDLIGSGGESGTPLISNYLSRRDRETLDSFAMMLAA